MVQYYQPENILELGTSFGITTAYLACGNEGAKVYTCEGAKQIASIAEKNFTQLNIKNITLVQGDFVTTLPPLFAVPPPLFFHLFLFLSFPVLNFI